MEADRCGTRYMQGHRLMDSRGSRASRRLAPGAAWRTATTRSSTYSCQARGNSLTPGGWPCSFSGISLSRLYPSGPRVSSLGLAGREVRPYAWLKTSKSLSSSRLGCYCDQIAFEFPIHHQGRSLLMVSYRSLRHIGLMTGVVAAAIMAAGVA